MTDKPAENMEDTVKPDLKEEVKDPTDDASEKASKDATAVAGENSSVFSCAVCQKTFTRKYHLDRHLRISKCSGLPVPTFPCELCSRVYTRKVCINYL